MQIESKSDMRTFASLLKLEDGLIEIFNRIHYGMTLKGNLDLPLALRKHASLARNELGRGGFLTIERAKELHGVEAELRTAETAEDNGNYLEVWAALVRAHGMINRAILDFMTNDWPGRVAD